MSRNHIQQANQIEMIENSSRIKLAVCLLLAFAAFPLCTEKVRLSSLDLKPYETLNFVAQDRSRAVGFVFQLKDGQAQPVRPQGLDAAKRYSIHELNPAPGRTALPQEGKMVTGEELMRDGLMPSCAKPLEACVIELAS